MTNLHIRSVIFGVLVINLLIIHLAIAQTTTELLLIRRNGLYGYADSSGRQVIAPRFDEAGQFSEGLAAVRVGDNWGYVDVTGVTVITPQFESADRFSEGLAAVELSQRFGYIGRDGKFAIPARFERAKAFSDGLAIVRDGADWLVLNPSGSVTLRPQYDIVESFSQGRAAVKGQGLWGYIDHTGNLAIPLRFARAGSFSNGLAPARLEANSAVGFIDFSGDFKIKPQFREAGVFANGLAAVQTDKTWGFIDTGGQLKISSRYSQAGSFLRIPEKSLDRALAQVTDRVYGRTLYIDRSGQIAFEMSDVPETRVGGYRRVKVEITTPIGAKVYLVPRDDWDSDSNLINNDDKLNLYRPKERDTAPVTTEVYEQTLILVYSINGKRGWKLVDVVGPDKNSIGITP